MAQEGTTAEDRRSAIARLRDVSPALYRGVIVALGLAAALSLYRTMLSSASHAEILTFAVMAVVLVSGVTLLEWLFRTEARRLATASLVVIAAAAAYGLGVVREEASGPSAPTIEAQPVLCGLIGLFCRTPAATAPGAGAAPAETPAPAAEADGGPMPGPVGPNRVWLQFAGSLDRAAHVVPLALSLEAAGWTVPSAAGGGERIATAAGRSEIRYFFPEDRANAERLAEAVRRSALPRGIADRLVLVPLDAARFRGVREGTLELWLGD